MSLNEITVIIQGTIYAQVTDRVIASVRQRLPQAKIILSTCDRTVSEDIKGYDKLIISPDPGCFRYPECLNEHDNNVNRQIVTTLAGLQQVDTIYVLKLRSDFELSGNEFLKYFDIFPQAERDFQVFAHKILACCYFTRNPSSDKPFPFHPSDLVFFGYTKDLLKLFDIPLMSKKQAYWNMEAKHQYQYVPEQYIFINCLRKNGFSADCNFYNDCNQQNIEQTEHYFASNFIFLSFEQFNLLPYKNTFSIAQRPKDFLSCYTYIEWQKLYQKYVDNTLTIVNYDAERTKINQAYKRYKKFKFIANLIAFFVRDKLKRRSVRNRVIEFFIKKI